MGGYGGVALQAAYPFAWLFFLLDFALKGTVIVLAATAAARLLRRASASTRHYLWLSALGSVLLLPVATNLLPEWRVPLLPELIGNSPELSVNRSAQSAVTPEEGQDHSSGPDVYREALRRQTEAYSIESIAREAGGPVAESTQGQEGRADETASAAGSAPEAIPPIEFYDPSERLSRATEEATNRGRNSISESLLGYPHWSFWIFAIWFAGAALVVCRLTIGAVGSYLIIALADEDTSPEWIELLHLYAKEAGLGRQIRLMSSRHLTLPKTGGIIWPLIVLPAEAREWETGRLATVLRHELAHIRRWDILTLMVSRFACALNWFNPLFWYAHLRLRNEMERACDDSVIAAGTKPSVYALHLTEIARTFQSPRSAWTAAAMAHRSSLKDRLMSILDPAARRKPLSLGRIALVAALLLGFTLPLAAFQPWAVAESPRVADIIAAPQEGDQESGLRSKLLAALSDEDAEIRQRAAIVLGRARDESAVDPLIAALEDENAGVRKYAAWALGQIGNNSAVAALARALEDPVAEVRHQAMWALGQVGDPPAEEAFVGALQNEEAIIRMQAARALRQSDDEAAIDALISALDDIDSDVRLQAVWALGRIGDERAVPGLIKALSDVITDIRMQAVLALSDIGGPQSINGLAAALNDEDADVRRAAIAALGESASDSIDPLIHAATVDENSENRREALNALRRSDDVDALRGFVAALNDGNSAIRRSAIDALGESDSSEAIEPLIHAATTDGNTENRIAALNALLRLRDNRVFPAFAASLNSDVNEIREIAVDGLCELDSPNAAVLLSGVLIESYTFRPLGDEYRLRIILTLRDIGDPRAAEALRYIIHHSSNPRIRNAAAEALQVIEGTSDR